MKIGYLVSQYPAISHTFIQREVRELRERGTDIDTFSVRRTERSALLSDADRREFERTWAILPAKLSGVVKTHANSFRRRPRSYLRTLREAFTNSEEGVRGRLWGLFYFTEAILLADELRKRGIQHLHNHFANAGGEVGYLGARYLAIPWSVTLHGTADYDDLSRLGYKLERSKFAFCVSHFGRAQALRAISPENWDRVFIARCGVDLDEIRPFQRPADRPNLERRKQVLSVGRLSAEKGQCGLLQSLEVALNAGIDAELLIIGEGPERKRLEAAIAERRLGERVRLPGACEPRAVFEAMSQADVFVMSSLMEGLPVVLMEAMFIGLPVVAPRLSGIPELVEHQVTGVLYTPADYAELGEKLVQILNDPVGSRKMAQNARRRVAEEFAIERAVEPLYRCFKGSP